MVSVSGVVASLRLPFLTASVLPALLGIVLSWWVSGSVAWVLAALTIVGVAALHVGSNVSNDFFDQKNDAVNKTPTPFSGGSRVIQNTVLTPKQVKAVYRYCYGFALLCGIVVVAMTKNVLVASLGLSGLLFGYFYTASPIKLAYKGYGDLLVFLCFGPLLVIGSYAVQTGFFTEIALLAGIPVGIFTMLILVINGFPDYQADSHVGKRSMAVRKGKAATVSFYGRYMIAAYALIVLFCVVGLFPLWTLLSLVPLPLAWSAYNTLRQNFSKKPESYVKANAQTIAVHALSTLLLGVGFVIDKVMM